jgi:integrase
MVGYLPDGRKDMRRGSAKTQAQAILARDQARRQQQTGVLLTTDQARETVGAYLERWLEGKVGLIRPRTQRLYGQFLRNHLLPALGAQRFAELRPETLRRLYSQLRRKTTVRHAPLSESTVHHIHVMLQMALDQAVLDGYCARNPARLVTMPPVPRPATYTPTLAEMQRFLAATEGSWGLLWRLAIESGCRIGELLGLCWSAVGPTSVTISQTLQGASAGVPRFGPPKTANGVRTIALAPATIAALQQHRDAQTDLAGYGLVFSSAVGRPLLYRNVYRRFKQDVARAGLPARLRIHDCRHFAATIMMQGQVPLRVVSARLGHASVGITAQLYQHPNREDDQSAAVVLHRLLAAGIDAGTAGIPGATLPLAADNKASVQEAQ